MAAPIQLKANTPGGNSYSKSTAAQKAVKGGKPQPMANKPKLRVDTAKASGGAGIKPAYAATTVTLRPKIKGLVRGMDSAASWMQSKGLKNAQNGGSVQRVPWANIPADGIGAASGSLSKSSRTASKPNPAKRTTSKSSSATTKSRVKTTYTGKAFKSGRSRTKKSFGS